LGAFALLMANKALQTLYPLAICAELKARSLDARGGPPRSLTAQSNAPKADGKKQAFEQLRR
jgi:hypothetical protein